MKPEESGQAIIERDAVVIRISKKALPEIVEGAWATGNLTPRFKITDADAFAEDLVRQLNDEDEEGTTCIHQMFDKAIEEAINQGAEGIEEHETQDA